MWLHLFHTLGTMTLCAPNRSGSQRIVAVGTSLRRIPRNRHQPKRRARATRKRVRPARRRRSKRRTATLTNKLHSPIITPAQMRTAEEAAFARGITAEKLMEE